MHNYQTSKENVNIDKKNLTPHTIIRIIVKRVTEIDKK